MVMQPTMKQKVMLEFIEDFTSSNGYAPTYREIAANLGYKSVATVAEHIQNLAEKGLLDKLDFKPRALKTRGKPEFSPDFADEIIELESLDRLDDADILRKSAEILKSIGKF